jgi:flagellin-like protein
MKNFRRSKKALSPVVASIILIAVTVAVSIAVAAWMGALTIGFMGTEEVRITNVEFLSATQAEVTVKNTGSTAVTISEAYVGNDGGIIADNTLDPGDAIAITVTGSYQAGISYQFKVVSTKGNPFVYTATAPNPLPVP